MFLIVSFEVLVPATAVAAVVFKLSLAEDFRQPVQDTRQRSQSI